MEIMSVIMRRRMHPNSMAISQLSVMKLKACITVML